MTISRSEVREEIDSAMRHYATKAELSSMETRLVKWMVGLLLVAVGAGISIGLFLERIIG